MQLGDPFCYHERRHQFDDAHQHKLNLTGVTMLKLMHTGSAASYSQ